MLLECRHDPGHRGRLHRFPGRQCPRVGEPSWADAGQGRGLGRGQSAGGLLAQPAVQPGDRQAQPGSDFGFLPVVPTADGARIGHHGSAP